MDSASPENVPTQPLNVLLALLKTPGERRDHAWAECYRRTKDMVWRRILMTLRFASGVLDPRAEGEDLMQDFYVGLLDAVDDYTDYGSEPPARSWMLAVLRGLLSRYLKSVTGNWTKRSTPRRMVSVDHYLAQIEDALATVEEDEEETRLQLEQLTSLFERWRRDGGDALRRRLDHFLRFHEGHSHRDLAEEFGIGEGTSRNWVSRTYREIRAALGILPSGGAQPSAPPPTRRPTRRTRPGKPRQTERRGPRPSAAPDSAVPLSPASEQGPGPTPAPPVEPPSRPDGPSDTEARADVRPEREA